MTQLKTLDISNIRHLSVQKYGLSVRQTVPLRITISDSSCHNSLPKFSGQNSYETVELYNVKIHLNCSCQKDLTHYHCQTLNTTTGKTEFQKYEDFDESYCDHENHHHSIFDEILEELPDDKYVLIGIEKTICNIIKCKVRFSYQILSYIKYLDVPILFLNSNRRGYGVDGRTTIRVFYMLPLSPGMNSKSKMNISFE